MKIPIIVDATSRERVQQDSKKLCMLTVILVIINYL